MQSTRRSRAPARASSRRRQHGYSLHDLLVTLVVAGTVAAFGLPSLKQLVARQRLTTTTNLLVTALHLARSEAITRGQRATLCPSRDARTCSGTGSGATEWQHGYFLYIDLNADRRRDGDEPVVRVFSANDRLRISTSAHRDHVTYQPSGLASGTNVTFRICDPAGGNPARIVIVSNSGRPRVTPGPAGCPDA